MDNFECSVTDLQNKGNSDNKKGNLIRQENGPDIKNENKPEIKNENVTDFITNTFLNKLNETRSIRIILTVIIAYLILNSDQVNGLIFNMFPYLMNSATESNLFGKIIIALCIGISVILSISFLQAP